MSVRMPNMVGFSKNNANKVIEYLPSNEQFSTQEDQRAIFFSLYNHYVEKEMRFTSKEIANGQNIYDVFKNKMDTLGSSTQSYKKLFNLIYSSGETKLLFDLDDMFLHLVYERTKKVNPDVQIHLLENAVLIKSEEEEISSTLLIPAYLKFDQTVMGKEYVNEQFEAALKALNETEIKQVYLVYPKHPSFTKHMNVDFHNKVKLREEEYRVKVIPYSFSFCTKKQKKDKKTRRYECQ